MSTISIYSIINATTGQFTATVDCPEDHIDYMYDPLTENYIDGTYTDLNYYVLNGVATLKPTQPTTITSSTLVANGTATITIGSIVNSTLVSVDVPAGGSYIPVVNVTDGSVVFSTTYAGTYTFNLVVFPYLPMTYSVVAS